MCLIIDDLYFNIIVITLLANLAIADLRIGRHQLSPLHRVIRTRVRQLDARSTPLLRWLVPQFHQMLLLGIPKSTCGCWRMKAGECGLWSWLKTREYWMGWDDLNKYGMTLQGYTRKDELRWNWRAALGGCNFEVWRRDPPDWELSRDPDHS